jgi:hypothetical protein
VGTTNVCGVSVTDAGAPAMTAESEVQVVVVGLPVIHSLQVANGIAQLAWSAVPNGHYQVQCTDDLNSEAWIDAGEVVLSAGFNAAATCPAPTTTRSFFRIRVEP